MNRQEGKVEDKIVKVVEKPPLLDKVGDPFDDSRLGNVEFVEESETLRLSFQDMMDLTINLDQLDPMYKVMLLNKFNTE